MRGHRVLIAIVLAVTATGSLVRPASASPGPRLRLVAASSHIDVFRYGTGGLYLDLGVFVAALDAPFEIRVARSSYTEPIRAWQVLQHGATRDVPTEDLWDWWGLKAFAGLQILRDGQVIRSMPVDWCPGYSDEQRVNDEGPLAPTYPWVCGGNPFTLGSVFGIDEGWASSLASGTSVRLRDGEYTARVRIRPVFRDLFQIAPQDASVRVAMTVKPYDGGGCPGCPFAAATSAAAATSSVPAPTTGVPTDTNPALTTVPDLVPLPAYGIRPEHYGTKDWLTFGADVWNAGPAPLTVEGFRRDGEDLMDAYQYFTRDGQIVGRAPVGAFEYDNHVGHEHWHFLQFARYRLLGADGHVIVKSRKQAFCLAPTDAIDLLRANAERSPGVLGFSRCGGLSSLWIREFLPVGWGDTYYQGLIGQGFDMTNLPNGTYFIEVTANPKGLLYESDTANNTQIREVILRGVPGARHVSVPAWNGIDSERMFR